MTCSRSVVFSGYSGFLLQSNWLPGYNWSIAQSGVKHHIPNLWIRDKVINCLIGIHNLNMIYLDWVLTSWWVTGEYGSPILSSSGLLLVYSSSDHAPSSLIDIGDSGDLISIPTGSVDVVLLFNRCWFLQLSTKLLLKCTIIVNSTDRITSYQVKL